MTCNRNLINRRFVMVKLDPSYAISIQTNILDKLGLPYSLVGNKKILSVTCPWSVEVPDYIHKDAAIDLLTIMGYVSGSRSGIKRYYMRYNADDLIRTSAEDTLTSNNYDKYPDLCSLLGIGKEDSTSQTKA